MKDRHRYVISYDIPEDRRRQRVARVLEGHGERVQYSVFECVLTEVQFERLWGELGRVIVLGEDSLRAYRLCPACGGWTRVVGQAVRVEVAEVYVA